MTDPAAEYMAEVRCMFCDCLLGMKPGFLAPGLVSHGIGECCQDWMWEWIGAPKEVRRWPVE